MDDEQLRYETEMGHTQVWFYEQRVEETRAAMVEAEHRYLLYSGSDLDLWREIYTAYQCALERWRDARQELHKAHANVEAINAASNS